MKCSSAVAVLPFFAAALTAQADALEQRRDQKLARPVFARADWSTVYDAARTRAASEDKLVLLYFTRSFAP